MQAVFYDREFNAAGYLGGLFEISKMDWGLPGGSKEAVLRKAVRDLESELARAVESLRFGVDIHVAGCRVRWNRSTKNCARDYPSAMLFSSCSLVT